MRYYHDNIKYRKCPSISAIKEKCKKRKTFYFSHVTLEKVFKEIKKLGTSKVTQETENTKGKYFKNSKI